MWRDFQKTLEDRVFAVIAGCMILVVTLMACWIVAAERREPSQRASILREFPDTVDELAAGVSFGSKNRGAEIDPDEGSLDGIDPHAPVVKGLPLEYCECCEANRPVADWVIYGVADDLEFTEDGYKPGDGDRIEWKVTAASKMGAPLIGVWYSGTIGEEGMDVSVSVNGVGCGRLEDRILGKGEGVLAEMPAPRMVHAGDVIVVTVKDPKSVRDIRALQPAGLHERKPRAAQASATASELHP